MSIRTMLGKSIVKITKVYPNGRVDVIREKDNKIFKHICPGRCLQADNGYEELTTAIEKTKGGNNENKQEL